MPLGVYAIDKKLDDPVGALTAHGLCGVWGTLACGLFTLPALAEYNAVGDPGLVYSGLVPPAGRPGPRRRGRVRLGLHARAIWCSGSIKKTYGLRVTAEEEDAGLDISEHGMYGYPEQFIPAPELVGYGAAPQYGSPTVSAPAPKEVTA